MSFNRLDDLLDTFPVVGIFGLPVDDLEALENVYDIVDPSPLHRQLLCALV